MFALFGLSDSLLAQTPPAPPVLTLQAPGATFASSEYYIARVVDERPSRTTVAGMLIPGAKPDQPAVLRQLDLQGGTLAALRQFVTQSLPHGEVGGP
ncbi:hypothetical protein [Hymenobacter cellulosilyticus]|uniref:Uncharacterized protein n=1 Tax=Hymenobacter cellulosilyticus TaxID=2932248 RepID=A0A8T9PYB0_9BACT|nr:hypothetical protein [Hymenobacter cellulosilyticus]UOQ70047.1 hypothetical protein MUN79_14780 [Hymenobacter cellulosilyticus]